MSQLPTGQTGPTTAVRVRGGRGADDIPRIGIQGGVDYSPVIPLPFAPPNENDNLALALARSMGVVADGLQVTAQAAEQQRALAKREAAEQERVWRGTGAELTLEMGPQELDNIRQGKSVPNEGESPSDFADRRIRELLPFPNDEENAAAYELVYAEARDRLSGPFQNALIARRNADLEITTEKAIGAIVAGANGKSPEELRAAAVDINRLDPRISTDAALSTLGTQSMEWAALQGEEGRAAFDAAASVMPENSIERLRAQNTLEGTIDRQDRQRKDAFNTKLAGLYVDIENGEASFAQVRSTIDASRKEVGDDRVIDDAQMELNRREARMLAEQLDLRAALFNESYEQGVIDAAVSEAKAAYDTGGFRNVHAVEWVDPQGKPQKLPEEEIERRAMDSVFAEIDTLGLTPDVALSKKAEKVGDNGYKYEGWSQLLESGPMSGIQAFEAKRDGESLPTVPANLRDGYQLYKDLGKANPTVLASHVSESTATFYAAALLAETYIDKDNPKAALYRAMTMSGRKAFGVISQKDVEERIDWIKGADNANEMAATVRGLADVLLGSGVVPDPATAVKEAAKLVRSSHRRINNGWVNVSNRAVPPDIEQLGDKIISDYVLAHGESEGVTAKNLSFVPHPSQIDAWVLQTGMGSTVESGQWLYRTRDLKALSRRMAEDRLAIDIAQKNVSHTAIGQHGIEDRDIRIAIGLDERKPVRFNGFHTLQPPRERKDPFAE